MALGRGMRKTAVEHFLQALELTPDAALAQRATELALSIHDKTLARRAARDWLTVQPSSLEAREVLLRLALQRNDTQQATEQARAIIDRHPGGAGEGFRLVALVIAQNLKDADTALSLIDGLVAAYPETAASRRAQALVALHFKRYRAAETAARRALALKPGAVDAGMLLIASQINLGDLRGADATVRKLAPKSSDQDIRLAYVRLLLEAKHSKHARTVLTHLIARSPHDADAHYLLGLLELSENRLAAARKQFLQLHGNDSHEQEAQYYLGRIAELHGHPKTALKHYDNVTSGDKALDAAMRRALLLGRLGQVDQARRIFEQLRGQYPPLAGHFAAAEAQMLMNAGRPAAAVQVLEKALQQSPGSSELLYGRALAYEKLGRVGAAEADLHRIIDRNPEDAQALNALGYMMTIHGSDYAKARQLIEKANRLSPNDAAIMDSLGWVIYRQGRAGNAVDWLRKAYARQADPEIAVHLVTVLDALGDLDEARQVARKALARDPNNAQLREALDKLRK